MGNAKIALHPTECANSVLVRIVAGTCPTLQRAMDCAPSVESRKHHGNRTLDTFQAGLSSQV